MGVESVYVCAVVCLHVCSRERQGHSEERRGGREGARGGER